MGTSQKTLIERARLLALVERNVLIGLDTPGKLLRALPELGSAETARRHLRAVHARWEVLPPPEPAERARVKLICELRRLRDSAWRGAQECESTSERLPFLRIVDRSIEREERLHKPFPPLGAPGRAVRPAVRPYEAADDETDAELAAELDRLERELGLDGQGDQDERAVPEPTAPADAPPRAVRPESTLSPVPPEP